ncbi:hypothetical protein Agabi119p4_6182 [Agaricus bisporus var. burnettii]|uniref:DNA 3'-5' helicase n=1 Tax=Agaricus bisporus var. burnettii TaxID=192524 RepID=A0A8H7KGC9_AGABI|nr:hypothetical protein Agabi119p4_6182 [Agaricus bisporus var. burnettii]
MDPGQLADASVEAFEPQASSPTVQQNSSETTENQSHICQTPLLREHSLVINTLHRIMICIACKSIINQNDVRAHFLSRHKAFRTRLTLQEEIDDVLSDLPLLTNDPPHPSVAIDAIFGLGDPLADHIECLTCHHCYVTMKTFKLHSCPDPKPSLSLTHVQRFRDFSGSPWFPVKPLNPPLTQLSPWTLYKQNVNAAGALPEPPSKQENHRIFKQFLHKEGWIERIGGQLHESLIPLVSYSAQDPTCRVLQKHLVSFLAHVQGITQSYFLRRLLSIRPAEEHDESKVRHHRSVNYETLEKYARKIASLILFIYRVTSPNETTYECPVTLEIATACHILVSSLNPSLIDEEIDIMEEPVPESDAVYNSDQESDSDNEETTNHPDTTRLSDAPTVRTQITTLLYALYTQIPSGDIRGEFYSPITHYVLLSSLRKDQEWVPAGVITQTIAAILFTGRLVFSWKVNDVVDRTQCTINDAFEHEEKYFRERSETILPSLYLLKRGLSSLQSADESAIHFNAPDLSGRSAVIEGVELNLSQFGVLHTQTLSEITATIDELTFHHPNFNLDDNELIYDEPRECRANYSFVTESRNIWNHRPSLLQHILETPHLFHQFAYTAPDGTIAWISTAVADYLRKVYDLQTKLICTIVTSYGEPARGTELASHLLSNVGGGSIRNFFVLFNIPVLRASFNKSSSNSGSDKVICRFPLPELRTQLLRFFVYIRPLYFEWQRYLRPHMAFNASHYLFAGLHSPITSYDISSALANYTEEHLNVRLSLRTFRQYMAFMTSCNHTIFARAAESDAGTHHQFGHSAEMNVQHYGLDSRTPSGMNIKLFFADARVSAVFHLLYGHPPTLLQRLEAGKSQSQMLITTIESIRSSAPPVHLSKDPTEIPNSPDMFARIKQLIDTSIATSHAAITHLFTPPNTLHEISNSVNETEITVHPYVLRKLRESYSQLPPNMSFSNQQQAQVTQLLFDGDRHVVYVAPTGSGKTTPPMLSARWFDSGRSTLCILPLVAMHIQYQHAARVFEIEAESWKPNITSFAPPTLVLATIDHATFKGFKSYVTMLVQKRMLARILIDEAHLILTHADFRPVMSLLQWLATIPVPILVMTATLPPSLEKPLLAKIGITTAYVVRATTPRANISFRVVRAESKLDDAVVREYRKAMAYSDKNRVLVFCLSVREAIHYGKLLGIPSCYSSLGFDELNELLGRFRDDANVRALATTSILGVGLDIPAVTHTIHVRFPRDVISYVQEAGRAGRGYGHPPRFLHSHPSTKFSITAVFIRRSIWKTNSLQLVTQ